jgi:hypothetical protein
MKRVLVAIAIGLLLSVIGLTINSVVANAATDVQCKSASDTHSWGFWPAEQFVTDHTYWCYGIDSSGVRVITSKTTTVTESVNSFGSICEGTGTSHWQIASGTNYREWTDEGNFKCSTNIPGYFIYPQDKMTIWVDAEGQYCGPDYCPCKTNNNCGK